MRELVQADEVIRGDTRRARGGEAPGPAEVAEFQLDEPLTLPAEMTVHELDGKVLFVAPEKALWLTTSLVGSQLVECLRRGRTLRQSCSEVAARSGVPAEGVERELRALLRQIAIKGFYEDHEPEDEEADAGRLALQIHLTQSCNLRCKHCYMNSGIKLGYELSLSEWRQVIDQFVELGGTSVTYSGGEPLLFGKFYELAAYVREKGLKTLLITNGTLIKRADQARRLSRRIDKVRVSVDGATAEGHETIRGRGTFAPTRRALALLSRAGVPVEIAITLYPENTGDVMDHLPAFLRGLQELGVRPERVGISRGMLEGRATDALSELEFERSFLALKRLLYGPLWELTHFKSLRLSHCGYGEGLTVSSTGAVYPCGIFYRTGGNVRTTPLSESFALFQAERRASTVDRMQPCAGCDLRHLCAGGCRVIHREATDDLRRADCPREYKRTYYRRLAVRDEVFFRMSATLDGRLPDCNTTIRERR